MNWSQKEKKVARKLYNLALERDYERLIEKIKEKIPTTKEQVWELRDFLNLQAKEFDRKYDYRYSVLINTFYFLLQDGLLTLDELKELGEEKFNKIKGILRCL